MPNQAESKTITIEPTDGSPRLMFVSQDYFKPEFRESVRRRFMEALEGGSPVVVDGRFEVFQLVDGEWRKLG